MTVQLITPDAILYDDASTSVKVPGISGAFEIREGHAPIVSSLVKGEVHIKSTNGQITSQAISQGFVEVNKNHVKILVKI